MSPEETRLREAMNTVADSMERWRPSKEVVDAFVMGGPRTFGGVLRDFAKQLRNKLEAPEVTKP